ncbi:hypothetical protein ACFX1S_007328 [Malus domestica]
MFRSAAMIMELHFLRTKLTVPYQTFWTNLNVLLVQANLFECGGSAVGASNLHKVADASTFSTLIRHWAELALSSASNSDHAALFKQFCSSGELEEKIVSSGFGAGKHIGASRVVLQGDVLRE